MSFTNDNQPREIKSFEVNGKCYCVYMQLGLFNNFLELHERDVDGHVDLDYSLMTATIHEPNQFGVIGVEIWEIAKETNELIVRKVILTRQDNLSVDITESFKTLLIQ